MPVLAIGAQTRSAWREAKQIYAYSVIKGAARGARDHLDPRPALDQD